MLDALARRERGNPIGRIARAVALALRLELDAAALILEPLALQSDVARAIGAAVLAPCARRVTRARVDSDRDDRWVDSIDPELGAMLVALAAALSFSEDASRDVERCARALARLEPLPSSVQVDSTRTTLRIAQAAARVRRGELDRVVALDQVAPLAQADGRVEAPFHVVVRSLASAAFSDSPRAAADLERAERTAAETGTTLLDAASAAAFGAVLAMVSPRDERGLPVLERAGTLLAHGDAPSLEHEAEQHRAIVLIALGRWGDAVVHLRAAREAAHAERAGELEIMSAALETVAELALGNTQAAYEAAAILGDARLAGAKARTAALAWVARALASLSASDREGAEAALKQAEARARAADRKNVDVFVLVEILGILFDSARGAAPSLEGSAAVLGRFAEERAIDSFHWLDLLNAIVERIADGDIRGKMGDALSRLVAVAGSLARERQAYVPPEVAV